MYKKIAMYFLYSIIFGIIFTGIDFLWITTYKTFIEKTIKNKKNNFINIYYLLFAHCTYFFNINFSNITDLKITDLKINLNLIFSIFLFYSSLSFSILFIIIFILKYDIIKNTNKYNYYYLLNAFISIILFIIYYSIVGQTIESPSLKNLLNKYLTPEEKNIYKKIFRNI